MYNFPHTFLEALGEYFQVKFCNYFILYINKNGYKNLLDKYYEQISLQGAEVRINFES